MTITIKRGRQIICSSGIFSNIGIEIPNYLYSRLEYKKKKKKCHFIVHYKIPVHSHYNRFLSIQTHQFILSGNPPTCLWFSHHLCCGSFSLKSNSSLWKKSSALLPSVHMQCLCCGPWVCASHDMFRLLLFILSLQFISSILP